MPLIKGYCSNCKQEVFLPNDQAVAFCCYCGEKIMMHSAVNAFSASGINVQTASNALLENDLYFLKRDIDKLSEATDIGFSEYWGKITDRIHSMREKDARNPMCLLYNAIFEAPSMSKHWHYPSHRTKRVNSGPLFFVYGYPEPMYVLREKKEKKRYDLGRFSRSAITREDFFYRKATLAEWICAVEDHPFFENIKEFMRSCDRAELVEEFASCFIKVTMNSYFMGKRIEAGRLAVDDVCQVRRHGQHDSYEGYFGHGSDYEDFFFDGVKAGQKFGIAKNIKNYLLPYLKETLTGPHTDYLLEILWDKANAYDDTV